MSEGVSLWHLSNYRDAELVKMLNQAETNFISCTSCWTISTIWDIYAILCYNSHVYACIYKFK